MRSHGVPSFPDPDPQGDFPPFHTGVSKQTSVAANDACKHLLSRGGSTATPQQRAAEARLRPEGRPVPAQARVPQLPGPQRLEPDSASRCRRELAAIPDGGDELREAGAEGARPAVSPTSATAAIVTAGLALLAAGCGSSPAAHVTGSTTTQEQRSGRLLALHALARGVEVPRSREQRSAPQGRPGAARGQQLPVPGGPERLQAPAPERRRGPTAAAGAAGEERRG